MRPRLLSTWAARGVESRRLRQLLYDGANPGIDRSATLKKARSQLAAVEQDVANYL